MKLSAFILLISFIGLQSCTKDKTTVQVIRNPLLKFDLDITNTWSATSVTFAPLEKVVVYPVDTTSPAIVYNRLSLNATGKATSGDNLELVISFDVIDPAELRGRYTPLYSLSKGLRDVKLYNTTNPNNLSVYSLCADNNIQAHFQIDRQNNSERLISGIFQMTTCNDRDSTQKIKLINGTFNDIRY